jgi:hypothetical protein
MASIPLVAVETATGTTGSDGLAVFTFTADIETNAHEVYTDRFRQGSGIDYTVTGTRQITFIAGSIPIAGARVWLFNGPSASVSTSALPAWETVASIITDAAVELGLVTADITDPFASTDQNIFQLLRLLKSAGRDLVSRRIWTHLQKEYTFSTVASTASYGLPSDFRSMVSDTHWDRTTQFPVGGPIGGQDWQLLQAVTGTSLFPNYRIRGGLLYLTPTPTAVETIAYEYNSTSWIMPVGQTSPTSTTPTLYTDTVCFDPLLMVKRIKRDFLLAKGFDAGAAGAEYVLALANAESNDSPGQTFYISGSRGGCACSMP